MRFWALLISMSAACAIPALQQCSSNLLHAETFLLCFASTTRVSIIAPQTAASIRTIPEVNSHATPPRLTEYNGHSTNPNSGPFGDISSEKIHKMYHVATNLNSGSLWTSEFGGAPEPRFRCSRPCACVAGADARIEGHPAGPQMPSDGIPVALKWVCLF